MGLEGCAFLDVFVCFWGAAWVEEGWEVGG